MGRMHRVSIYLIFILMEDTVKSVGSFCVFVMLPHLHRHLFQTRVLGLERLDKQQALSISLFNFCALIRVFFFIIILFQIYFLSLEMSPKKQQQRNVCGTVPKS